jgi:hypothetical protein
MNRLEKCELLKSKGYTYNPETGIVIGYRGFQIKSKNNGGYNIIGGSTYFQGDLLLHHFAWYMTYGNVDFDELDHIDTNKNNNKIDNLRISNRSQQRQNTKHKGYTYDKSSNKWRVRIGIDGKTISLGRFVTEEEARNTYLQAKEKYHIHR